MEENMMQELIARADRLYVEGRLTEARKAYEEVLAQDDTVAWAYSRIGAILAQTGEVAEAEQYFTRALEVDPKLPQAHSNLGNLFYARGEYEQALAKYKEAAALDPDNAVFHENLHAAYKKLGKFTEAVAALKQAHRLGRQAAKEEAKTKLDEVKARMKGGRGCFGTVLITSLVLIVIAALVFQ